MSTTVEPGARIVDREPAAPVVEQPANRARPLSATAPARHIVDVLMAFSSSSHALAAARLRMVVQL
jgi:hypothetical protein